MKNTHEVASTQSDIRERLQAVLTRACVDPSESIVRMGEQLVEELAHHGVLCRLTRDAYWRETLICVLELLIDRDQAQPERSELIPEAP